MITAVRYLSKVPKDETRYLNPVPKRCIHTGEEEIHFWVTYAYEDPKQGSLCLCNEKKYRGLQDVQEKV